MKLIQKLIKNEEGATAIEYGLIAALIAVAMVAAVNQFSGALQGVFTGAATELNNSV